MVDTKTKDYFILSIDGGGIRGVIAAVILQQLEEKTGRPICEMFDAIGGTSTGGIIAAMLSCRKNEQSNEPKYPASKITELYEKEGKDIFVKNKNSIKSLLEYTYSSLPKRRLVSNYIGDTTFDQALVDVWIPSTDISLNKASIHFWSRYPESPGKSLALALMCTTAAPTYFKSVKVISSSKNCRADVQQHVDGGYGMNNPSYGIYNEMKERDSNFGENRNVYMVSLGTGSYDNTGHADKRAQDINKDHILYWGFQGLTRLISVEMEQAEKDIKRTLERKEPQESDPENRRYWRFNPPLGTPIALDDVKDETIKKLINLTEEHIKAKAYKSSFDELVELLKNRPDCRWKFCQQCKKGYVNPRSFECSVCRGDLPEPVPEQPNPDDSDDEVTEIENLIGKNIKPIEAYRLKTFELFGHVMAQVQKLQDGVEKIIAFGETGAGKSTLLSELLKKGSVKFKVNKKAGGHNEQKLSLKDSGVTNLFPIGNDSLVACTKEPQASYSFDDDILLIDTPGQFDTRGLKDDIPQQLATALLLKQLQNYRLLIVVSQSQLKAQKAHTVKKMIKSILDSCEKPEDFENFLKGSICVIQRCNDITEVGSALNDFKTVFHQQLIEIDRKDHLEESKMEKIVAEARKIKQEQKASILPDAPPEETQDEIELRLKMDELAKRNSAYKLRKELLKKFLEDSLLVYDHCDKMYNDLEDPPQHDGKIIIPKKTKKTNDYNSEEDEEDYEESAEPDKTIKAIGLDAIDRLKNRKELMKIIKAKFDIKEAKAMHTFLRYPFTKECRDQIDTDLDFISRARSEKHASMVGKGLQEASPKTKQYCRMLDKQSDFLYNFVGESKKQVHQASKEDVEKQTSNQRDKDDLIKEAYEGLVKDEEEEVLKKSLDKKSKDLQRMEPYIGDFNKNNLDYQSGALNYADLVVDFYLMMKKLENYQQTKTKRTPSLIALLQQIYSGELADNLKRVRTKPWIVSYKIYYNPRFKELRKEQSMQEETKQPVQEQSQQEDSEREAKLKSIKMISPQLETFWKAQLGDGSNKIYRLYWKDKNQAKYVLCIDAKHKFDNENKLSKYEWAFLCKDGEKEDDYQEIILDLQDFCKEKQELEKIGKVQLQCYSLGQSEFDENAAYNPVRLQSNKSKSMFRTSIWLCVVGQKREKKLDLFYLEPSVDQTIENGMRVKIKSVELPSFRVIVEEEDPPKHYLSVTDQHSGIDCKEFFFLEPSI